MKKVIALSFVALATTVFAAEDSYKVHIFEDCTVSGKPLKAGDYKVSVENGNAILKQGKKSVEVPAHEENGANKFPSTSLAYKNETDLQAISVGGTHTRIVFGDTGSARPGI